MKILKTKTINVVRMGGFALLLAASGVYVACSSDDNPAQSLQGQGNEINFRALGDRPVTKASSTVTADITSFTLQGIWNAGTDDAQKRLFDGVVVTRSEDGTSWDYSPKKTWPDNGEVRFFAYSPANSVNVTNGFKGDLEPEITYTVPILPEKQEDLLVAVTDELSAGTVPVNFKHALSRVLFRARSKKADVPVKIEKVTLMNLYTTGTWKLEPDALLSKSGVTPNADDDYSSGVPTDLSPFTYATYNTSYATAQMPENENAAYLTYTSGSNEHFWQVDPTKQADYTVDLSASNTVGKDYTSITGETQGLMVMPQATAFTGTIASPNSTDFYVQVEYSVGGSKAPAKNIRVYDWWKKAWGSFTFEPGKQYTFDMEVDPEGMITLSVGQVAAFTYPPIDVPKKFAVGDIVPLGVDGAMALVTQVDASDDSHGWALGATPLLAYSTSTPDATSFPASGPAYSADWANAAIDLTDYPMYKWFVEVNHGVRDPNAWVSARWASLDETMTALLSTPNDINLKFWLPICGETPVSGSSQLHPITVARSAEAYATFLEYWGGGGMALAMNVTTGAVSNMNWNLGLYAYVGSTSTDWSGLGISTSPLFRWFYILRF